MTHFLDRLHYICHRLVVFFFQACLLSLDNLGMLNGAATVLPQMKLQCDASFIIALSCLCLSSKTRQCNSQQWFNPRISFLGHGLYPAVDVPLQTAFQLCHSN